jgi:hypothetical protein
LLLINLAGLRSSEYFRTVTEYGVTKQETWWAAECSLAYTNVKFVIFTDIGKYFHNSQN